MRLSGLLRQFALLQRVYLLCMLAGFIAFTACNIDGDLAECTYNARVEYWYVGSGAANVLPDYVNSMQQYVYNSEGVLVQVNSTAGSRVVYGELNLPPGKYTLVSWANLDSTSRVVPVVAIGKSKLSEMELRMANHAGGSRTSAGELPLHHVSEPLYYSYTDLEIFGRGVVRKQVYMTHAHFRLNLTVKWAQYPPLDAGNFNYTLRGVPAVSRFAPGRWIESARSGGQPVPGTTADECGVSTPATMNLNRTLSGTLLSYRLMNDKHPVLSICSDGKLIVKEIDLWKYFNTLNIDLSNNFRQEFDLQLLIDGNDVSVSAVGVGDWEEGGDLGGFMKK